MEVVERMSPIFPNVFQVVALVRLLVLVLAMKKFADTSFSTTLLAIQTPDCDVAGSWVQPLLCFKEHQSGPYMALLGTITHRNCIISDYPVGTPGKLGSIPQ